MAEIKTKTFIAECVDGPLRGKLRRVTEGTEFLRIPDGRGGIAFTYELGTVGGLMPERRIWKLAK